MSKVGSIEVLKPLEHRITENIRNSPIYNNINIKPITQYDMSFNKIYKACQKARGNTEEKRKTLEPD